MDTEKFKFSPILLSILAVATIFFCYTALQNYTLSRIHKEEGYQSFSTIILETESTECVENPMEMMDKSADCTKVSFIDPTTNTNQSVTISSKNYQVGKGAQLEKGDIIRINKIEVDGEDPLFVFTGFDRTITYFWIFIIFLLVVVLIAGKKGVRSMFSLGLSVLIIGKVIIPLIISGKDPILVAAGIGFVMLAIQLYITNGINRPTTLSILGAAVGVLCSVIFAQIFSNMGKISGFGDENSGFLSLNAPNAISVRDLVVASFILGVLGVVDDATVSQVSVVSELKKNNSKMSKPELFKSAMQVGSSHIGSLMNTLFLAYVASALPLIILMSIYTPNFYEVINIDLFAEEIIRTVVGSLGLVLSIPASTYFAVSLLRNKDLTEHYHNH